MVRFLAEIAGPAIAVFDRGGDAMVGESEVTDFCGKPHRVNDPRWGPVEVRACGSWAAGDFSHRGEDPVVRWTHGVSVRLYLTRGIVEVSRIMPGGNRNGTWTRAFRVQDAQELMKFLGAEMVA